MERLTFRNDSGDGRSDNWRENFSPVCLYGYVSFEAVCGIWKCDRTGTDFSNNFVLKKRQREMFSEQHFALETVK